jgi:hypothetical protein
VQVALLQQGLRDAADGVESIEALLVLTAGPALRSAGVDVPDVAFSPEDRLYQMVAAKHGDDAHSKYNALLRSIVRARRAVAHAPVIAPVLREFMRALDADEGRVYLTGGASAMLLGWRDCTAAIDLLLVPPNERVLRSIAALKERLGIGVEPPPRDGFIPELPGWEERSVHIEGAFHHLDFHSQCLAQIERSYTKDLLDAQRLVDAGLVDPQRLRTLYDAIEPELWRHLAIHPPSFRAAVEAFLARQ